MCGDVLEHVAGGWKACPQTPLSSPRTLLVIPREGGGPSIPESVSGALRMPDTLEYWVARSSRAMTACVLLLRRSLLLVAQFAAQNLADIGLRQLGPKLDQFRHLVARELGLAIFDQVFGGDVRVLLHYERLHRFTRARVLHPDHRAFQDARMAGDDVFDLVRIDFEHV